MEGYFDGKTDVRSVEEFNKYLYGVSLCYTRLAYGNSEVKDISNLPFEEYVPRLMHYLGNIMYRRNNYDPLAKTFQVFIDHLEKLPQR